jgi:hypothetical protein
MAKGGRALEVAAILEGASVLLRPMIQTQQMNSSKANSSLS